MTMTSSPSEAEDRFSAWSTADFAAQCRMQAREQLDPEFAQFMTALSERLAVLASSPSPVETGSAVEVDQGCRVPPSGWRCSRPRGHEGPCAATQIARPLGAGWSAPPTQDADHDERLTKDELALINAGISEWAYNHLARGYAVSLTVREVKRLLAAALSPTPEREAYERAAGDLDLADRKMVNTILARHFSRYLPDIVERVQVGNAACTEILAALSQEPRHD